VVEILGRLAGRQDEGLVADGLVVQGALERCQVVGGHILVGYHHDPVMPQERPDEAAGGRQQTLADQDFVAARAQRDLEAFVSAHRRESVLC
jgi:hypothetical protein